MVLSVQRLPGPITPEPLLKALEQPLDELCPVFWRQAGQVPARHGLQLA
jgi:hypothetical protein